MPFGFLKKWFGKKETQKTIEEALKTESITVSQIEEKKVFPQKKTLQILSCQKNKTLKLKNIQVAQFISFLTKGNLRIELKIPYSGVNAREGRDFLEKEFEILREGLYGFPVPFSDLEIYPINHSLEVSFRLSEIRVLLDNLDYFLTLCPEEDVELDPSYPVAQAAHKLNELKILSPDYHFSLNGQHMIDIYASKEKLDEILSVIKNNYHTLAIPLENVQFA
ncbi:hypothetical protein J4417_03245 [Candidatus Woesearchaeota archaeon]|nr:hypothetical protein [Candidatus Woesearchaeota archaeon]